MFLEMKDLTKLFDKDNGVREFNLKVEEGEFVTILGPSGCGKTTTLNLLGGFLYPDKGEILLDELNITKFPPEKRPISTVFQNYALFPHMNVIENIAYGIRFYRKEKKRKAMEIAKDYINIVGLEGYEKSKVGNLSGGQQQRVALARSMATNPKILLLDEPLSNLDASLRVKMREELKELQKRLNITMIFVTHDQSEALSLSDKIVVMEKGNIVQIGSPKEIYFYPANEYVASFIGKSNLFIEDEKNYILRPEDIKMERSINGKYIIKEKVFMGQHTEYKIQNNQQILEVHLSGKDNSEFSLGDKVDIEISHKNKI
ncbi:ABC transporter ATP-binding protein [Tissierella sp. MB52-C2]|uniref:ABC transporter ATP-binding protein n=1 Tax=Tissierella sp. MB52-C2 TaxID=3070999 RepID=UPI00280B1BC7|nr:ABC transporter ATP-binding protein [Tissierella sp. MB52-C2]WMM24301.1 ABC transporter ATP-binding protein [Tissierella sp. MB52-C2]